MWQVAVDGAQTTAVFEPATSGSSAAVFVAGESVALEEFARQMIQLEELHAAEVDKMLRKPGDVATFAAA